MGGRQRKEGGKEEERKTGRGERIHRKRRRNECAPPPRGYLLERDGGERQRAQESWKSEQTHRSFHGHAPMG